MKQYLHLFVFCLVPIVAIMGTCRASINNPILLAPGQFWEGSYACGEMVASLTIEITSVRDASIEAIANFQVQETKGTYSMLGEYDMATRGLNFKSNKWIVRPQGFGMVGMKGYLSSDGTVYDGKIDHKRCGAFRVSLKIPEILISNQDDDPIEKNISTGEDSFTKIDSSSQSGIAIESDSAFLPAAIQDTTNCRKVKLYRASLSRDGVYGDFTILKKPKLKWKFKIASVAFGAPVVIDSMLYFGSRDKNVYAINTSSGEEQWKYSTKNGGDLIPAISGCLIFFGGWDSTLFTLNRITGEEIWKFKAGGPISSSPAVTDSAIYFLSRDCNFYSLDIESGKENWRFVTERGGNSSAAIVDSIIYFGSDEGLVYALNVSTGKEIWRFSTNAIIRDAPTVVDGMVFLGNLTGSFYALSAINGELLWRNRAGKDIFCSPTVADSMVYYGSKDGYLYACDIETGKVIWKYNAGIEITKSPSISGDHILLGTYGHLKAIDKMTGELKWDFKTGDHIHTSPIIEDGVIYFTIRNYLYALE
ncbi:MAG: PQQ-binding-like beta-propeller repeat protein [Candidatus Marinimicrobia bacterium]|nr:PQQ-binding-like beta-propeller repeat protein [Candidatus Neomarinimicrobiota bacterium]